MVIENMPLINLVSLGQSTAFYVLYRNGNSFFMLHVVAFPYTGFQANFGLQQVLQCSTSRPTRHSMRMFSFVVVANHVLIVMYDFAAPGQLQRLVKRLWKLLVLLWCNAGCERLSVSPQKKLKNCTVHLKNFKVRGRLIFCAFTNNFLFVYTETSVLSLLPAHRLFLGESFQICYLSVTSRFLLLSPGVNFEAAKEHQQESWRTYYMPITAFLSVILLLY